MPTAPTRPELSCAVVETYIALHAIVQRLQPIALAELERRNKRFLKSERKK